LTKAKLGLSGVVAIFFIALVLRPPVASIGPLLEEIQGSLNLSPAQVGFLAAAPVLCFGIGAFASPWLVAKVGLNRGMLLVLLLLAAASALRIFFGYTGLLVGTVGAGLSIAVANVLLPSAVRQSFPNRVALITGGYTTVLAVSASLAATIAVPSSNLLGGWNPALALWVIPTLLAIFLWFPQTRGQEPHVAQPSKAAAEEKRAVLKSPISWAIVGFFGIQSLGFYALLGWLPSALISIGISPVDAGGYLGLGSGIGIPAGLLVSSVLGKFKSLAWWSAVMSTLTLGGNILLSYVLFSEETTWLVAACVLIGFGMSTTFPICLSLISTRASTSAQTTQLSAMAQGWGYLIAAAGTFLVGFLANFAGGWTASFALLSFFTLVQVGVGFYAGKPGLIPAK
jgi:CP family cyanate transporter-like MFS transporter